MCARAASPPCHSLQTDPLTLKNQSSSLSGQPPLILFKGTRAHPLKMTHVMGMMGGMPIVTCWLTAQPCCQGMLSKKHWCQARRHCLILQCTWAPISMKYPIGYCRGRELALHSCWGSISRCSNESFTSYPKCTLCSVFISLYLTSWNKVYTLIWTEYLEGFGRICFNAHGLIRHKARIDYQ